MSIAWVAEQIRAATAGTGVQPPGLIRFNPKPPGQTQPGGATEAVIAFLAKHPGTWFTHAEILSACEAHSRKAISFALVRLQNWEAIEASPAAQVCRNSRYLRYRLSVKAMP